MTVTLTLSPAAVDMLARLVDGLTLSVGAPDFEQVLPVLVEVKQALDAARTPPD